MVKNAPNKVPTSMLKYLQIAFINSLKPHNYQFLVLHKTKKNSKASQLRSWDLGIFGIFA